MAHDRFTAWASLVAVTAMPSVASAHLLGPDGGGNFAAGFAHPFAGLDHQLAMLAIGLWSWQQLGRARLAIPAGFVAGCALGLVAPGLVAPLGPLWLAASVAALGACVAVALRSRTVVALVAAIAVGALHGHVHGSDLAVAASPAGFALGFLGATALLHAFGFSAGVFLPQSARAVWVRASGTAIGVAGLALLAVAFG